jgi:hypothetical protein
LPGKDIKWLSSIKLSRNLPAHYSVQKKRQQATTTTAMMSDNGLSSDTETSSDTSSTSSTLVNRIRDRMNMVPSLLQPLGAIPKVIGEQQEEEKKLELSSVRADNDPDDDTSAVAVPAIIADGTAGVVKDLGETEDTAPSNLITPPSISGGSRKQGVATTACASTSLTKKKKVAAAQCCKGACVKVTRSNLFHVLEHDEQRDTLEGYGNSQNFFGQILSGSGKQG